MEGRLQDHWLSGASELEEEPCSRRTSRRYVFRC